MTDTPRTEVYVSTDVEVDESLGEIAIVARALPEHAQLNLRSSVRDDPDHA